MKNATVIYLGCPKNLVLSEKILGTLNSSGYRLTIPEEAEVAFLLSCGFIEDAREETEENLNYLIELKRKNILKRIIFTGCMASFYKNEIKKNFPEVDEILAPEEISKYLKKEGRRIISTKGYAYLKIAEGCNHRCSFCIIPLLTGKYKSKKLEDIIEEAKELEEYNLKEIVLIAQDTTQYGKDIYGKPMLKILLEELLHRTSYKWIRLLYLYPETFPYNILDLMKKNKRIIPYFDLPFQHISKKILKNMDRGGDSKTFLRLINKIREEIPESTIRSTFIVGFPSETKKEFEELKNFLAEAGMDRVGFFIYSDEREAKSFNLKNKVPKKIAKERMLELAKIQKEISLKKHKFLIGKRLEFLLEEKKGSFGIGRLKSQAPEIDGYLKIANVPNGFQGIGFVEIKRVSAYNLFGKYYEDNL
jgi:ribosomal protein S12 methylthiotransferase